MRQVQVLRAEAMGVVLTVSFFWQCKANPAIPVPCTGTVQVRNRRVGRVGLALPKAIETVSRATKI